MLHLHVHRAAEQCVQYKTPLGRKWMSEQHFRVNREIQQNIIQPSNVKSEENLSSHH